MRAMVKGKEKHAGERMTSIGSIYAMMDGRGGKLPFSFCLLLPMSNHQRIHINNPFCMHAMTILNY